MEKSVSATTTDVFMRYMTSLLAGKIDEVMQNFTDESVNMSPEKTYRGLAEIQGHFQTLMAGSTPEAAANITVIRQEIYNEFVYMVWKAEPLIKVATGTFVIRDGKIMALTQLEVY